MFAATTTGGCANCNEDKAPPRPKVQREQAPLATEGKPLPPPTPPPGTPLAGDVFKPAVPDSVAGFTAIAAGEASSAPLANGGILTKFARSYRRGEQTLEVELADNLHAPLVPKVIEQQQGTERRSPSSELVGTTVGGQPSVLMFQSAARTATASVLLGSRVLLNVRIHPADDLQAAVEVAAALPLAALLALVPQADAGTALPDEALPAAEPEPTRGKAPRTKAAPAEAAPKAPRSPR